MSDLAAVRRLIAREYRDLEIVAQVPIDGVDALIVCGPATEALVRTPDDLRKWFPAGHPQPATVVPSGRNAQRSLF